MRPILIIINTLNPGGAERQAVNDANMLSEEGYKISIAIHKNGPLGKLLHDDIEVINLLYKNVLRASFRLFQILKKQKFDFVFGHMYWALKIAAFPCFITKQKFIFFEHGLGLWRKFYHLAILKSNQIFVKKIVVVSNEKRKIKIEREKTSKKKVLLIPNSFQKKEFNKIKKKSISDKFTKVIFIGRFNPVKQLEIIPLLAINLKKRGLDNFQFILCGTGIEEKKIKSKVKKYELAKYFRFTGYVDNPFQYLLESDIAILPSRIEDFSVSLLEAGYAGLPAIAFDVGGNSDIVKNNQTGYLIDPFNIEEYTDKLQELIENSELRKKLGVQAHEFVKSNFTEKHRLIHLTKMMNSITN